MRRVDAEGDSRGLDVRHQVESRKSKLRRASLEALERRELLSTSTSTLPAPVVIAPPSLGGASSANQSLSSTSDATSPTIAIDPVNPLKMVEIWDGFSRTPIVVGVGPVSNYAKGAYSVDGGVSWSPLTGADSANFLTDASASQSGGTIDYSNLKISNIAFGRDESVYMTAVGLNSGSTAGVLLLERFDFRGAAPVQNLTNKQIYAWSGTDGGADSAGRSDGIQSVSLAVDNNLSSFTDTDANGKTFTQIDPFAGNVYVAWAELSANRFNPIIGFNPQEIRMVASSDGGNTFTHATYVDDTSNRPIGQSGHSGAARYVQPTLTVSQGRAAGTNGANDAGVPGGQVTLVYDDLGTGAQAAPPFDRIVSQKVLDGGTAQAFTGKTNSPIGAGVTTVPVNVFISDPKFTTLSALDVATSIEFPSVQELTVTVTPPTAVNNYLTTQAARLGLTYPGFLTLVSATGVTGGSLGSTTGTGFGQGSGTVFDADAIRSIYDRNTKAPYVGHFAPEDRTFFQLLRGLTASQINGTWLLNVNDTVANTATTPKFVRSLSFNFSSGLTPGGAGAQSVVAGNLTAFAGTFQGINPTNPSTAPGVVVSASGNMGLFTGTLAPSQPLTTITTSPMIASDNTLGAYSQHQGRLYVSFTGRYRNAGAVTSTDIFLAASDDGGSSWTALASPANLGSPVVQVNDDNSTLDGFSASTPGAGGRTHFQSRVAVDQYTGNVVVAFYDARNDAANARVATYVAVSNDGGDTFAANVYANASNTAIDSITGKTVNLGPIPDNESNGINPLNTPTAFGSVQGLAVANGRIIPVWASNQNTGPNNYSNLQIVNSVMTIASGPRVISGTMGPVGLAGDTINTTRAADGSPVANSFQITFDKPIDPATFNGDGLASSGQPIGTGDVRVFYQDPYGSTTGSVTTARNTVANGTLTSTIAIAGHGSTPLVDGRLTLSLAGFTNLGGVTVQLFAPNGRSFTLSTAPGSTSLSGTYALPAGVIGGILDGTYQLKITDTLGQVGTLKSWSLALNGLSIGVRVLSVTPVPNLGDPLNDGQLGFTTFKVVFDPRDPSNGVPLGVGTYSYLIRPTLNDRIRVVATPVVSAGSTVNATGTNAGPAQGLVTSSIAITGHPYQFLVDNAANSRNLVAAAYPNGNVAVTVSAVITADIAATTLRVFLVTPDGERYPVNGVATTVAGGPNTFTITNANVAIPFAQRALDGNYTLLATDDGTSGQNLVINSYSIQLFGKTLIPVLPSTAVVENAQLPQLPVPGVALNGTTSSTTSLTLLGHPGQVIGSGTLALSLTDTNVNDLTITLTAPGGQVFTLPKSTGTALNQTYTLPASFLNTDIDGKYQLTIVGLAGDVGRLNSWSLAINPEGFVGPFVQSTGVPRVIPSPGSTTSTLVIDTILPGEQFQSGVLNISVRNQSFGGGNNISDLTIQLTGPGGQINFVPTLGVTATTLNMAYQIQPGFLAGLLSGTYTLRITNSRGGDVGTLLAWSIALAPKSLNGNAMDQNADSLQGSDPETQAFTGLTPGDLFAAPNPSPTTSTTFSGPGLPQGPYANSSLPLIVPGAHIVTTNVTGTGGATTGNSTDNLVANDQVGSIGVVFDRNIQISSLNSTQVLNILGPAGPITGPQTYASTGISKTFLPKTNQVNLTIPRGAGTSLVSNLIIASTGLKVSSLSVTLNITDPLDSSLTLTLISPNGTMVPLAANVGGNGANFSSTTFADNPPANGLVIPIAAGQAPFGLTYQPASPLSAVAGQALDGTWQLMIQDNTPAGSTLAPGRLNSWSLSITPQVPQGAGASPLQAPLSSLTSSLMISNPDLSFSINHLSVQLNLTTSVNKNITAILVAPDGTKVLLFSGVGGNTRNFVDTKFDDSATVNIVNGVAPFVQTYVPQATAVPGYSSLTSLNGKALNGTWKLVIVDSSTNGAASTLNSWSLIATPQIKITPSQTYTSTDASPTTYVSTDTTTQVYSSVGNNGTYANPLTIPATVGATITSNIVVPSSGGTFNLANLNVALAITYPRDTNLSVALISPGGVTIPLFAGVGGLGANFGFDPGNPTGQAFDYTIFSDSGTLDIANGVAPFDSGSVPFDPTNTYTIYRPASPLSVLNGTSIDGTWQLKVTNNSGLSAGSFDGWALIATPQAAPAANGLPIGSTQPAEPIPILFTPAQPPPGFLAQPSPQPLLSSITFPTTNGTYTLAALSATLTLTAPAGSDLSDLTAILVAPNGVQATLFTAGDGTFSGTGTATKTLTPLNAISGQSQFVNLAIDGAWQLKILDTNEARGGDVLNGWSLTTTPQVRASGQSSEPVPNTPASSLSSSINIPDNVPLGNLQLRLNLTASRDSNLTAVLIGPNNKAIKLFTNVGGAGVNFANVLFSDLATQLISLGIAPFAGTFKPENPFTNFLAGGLGSVQGKWTLVITDTNPNPNGPSASLNSWSLINTPPAGTTLANSFQVNFPTQQLSGTYSLTIGAGLLGADPSVNNPLAASNPAVGTPVDGNLNAGVDTLRGTTATGVVATVSTIYNATSVPVAIPKAPTANSPGVLVSQIVVPDNFVIQGVTSAGLPGLTVTLNITYPNDPDLSAVLIAPDGTRIPLFTNVGKGSNPGNFTNTILDDTVNPPASIDVAAAPFFGRFNPETPLSNLKGHASGGTWSLQISNKGTVTAGTLSSWTLTFQKPLPSSGLGDPVADRQTVNFRIFNIAPTNPLANDTWTAVGPAGITTTAGQTGTFAGSVATVAVDPSDPTGNTVYIGSASGGIWKTSNFLTTNPRGPTYLPLTDFGPTFSLNVGSIAVFGRNSNPDQSVLFAGTGFAQATSPYNVQGSNFANYGSTAGRGVGFLRSFDGGLTWALLDSTTNFDALGNPLPENSPLRDHIFVGSTTYKMAVDPTPLPNGNIIVYAAIGGPKGGLYLSVDSGNSWKLLSGTFTNPQTGAASPFNNAAATDIILDPNSKSPSTGNIDIIYAAFEGFGVFISSNQGQTLNLMIGQAGKDALITGPGFPAQPTAVGNAQISPNRSQGRYILAKPALTGNAAVDLLYQDWLYTAVETPDGQFQGLYVTKDRGENWTLAQLGNLPGTGSVKAALPTNDNLNTTSYDPTNNRFTQNGNYNLSMTIDPTNPNIVYLGGTHNFQGSGLIRVDLTNIYDAHNLVSFANDRNDGGLPTLQSTGAISVTNPTTQFVGGVIYRPPTNSPINVPSPYLNFRHAPNTGIPGTSPFNVNATLVVTGAAAAGFTNDGTGVTWSLFDEPLKANPGDTTGSTNVHHSVAYLDPVTGNVRLIFADDQGVFTALVNPDGTLDNGIGTDVSANYSRNGNLQNQQFFYGAAQPSNLAAQAVGALFYASGQGTLAAQSDPNILSNGNITWDNSAVLNPPTGSNRDTAANTSISSSDRGGVGIATDPTGGATASGPTGSGPSVYEFDVPSLGGNLTDFFRVNGVGATTGLAGNVASEFPFGNSRASGTSGNDLGGAIANGKIPLGNFAVNPLNGSQLLIGSAVGRLYQTTNKGVQWLPIGQPNNFDGTQLSAIVYGAPDPSAPSGVGNLNNFIYVGTVGNLGTTPGNVGNGGHIYVTQTGGQGWTDISTGLDGSSLVAIYTNPDRGSHEAYAVTLNGVFYSPDTVGLSAAGQQIWTNITGNLAQIQTNPFGSPALGQSVLATFQSNTNLTDAGTAQYGGFSSIVADYRYAIPDIDGNVHPVLYVSGFGGVFRSLDNGQTWTVFPNTAFDSAPVDGGYLPSVNVTGLQLNLGAINPATGHATQVVGDPEVLLATTFGRGAFAIRLAPDVFPSTISLDQTLPAPNGSDSGAVRGFAGTTNVKFPYIDGISEVSNFGNVVTITLIDQANGTVIGTGVTDAFGRFSIQVGSFTDPLQSFNDPSFLIDGIKNVGIQATDSSGAKGNITVFTYTLKATPPPVPTNLTLLNDSARFTNDPLTNRDNITRFIPPIFTVNTTEPATTAVQLYRFNSSLPLGQQYELVDTQAANISGIVTLTDKLLSTDFNTSALNAQFTYFALQIDLANNPSTDLSNIGGDPTTLTITIDNIPSAAPNAPTLDPSTNSGVNKGANVTNNRNPLFNVTGLVTNNNLQLFRSIGGSTPILVGTAAVGATQIRDTVGILVDGVYVYQVDQVDVAGNVSLLSQPTAVTINTQAPAVPTLFLFAPDASGAPSHPNVTNIRSPRFNGVGTPGLSISLFNVSTGQGLSTTTVAPNGTYLTQIVGPIADGTYTIVARITNAAGNSTDSAPLTFTIKASGPVIVPTLAILAADDTGLKSDGVTANHHPRFTGKTDPGDQVTLYALVNGKLSPPQATATASTVNGSFTFQLPFNLTNGSTQLVAQATDVAGNVGQLSPVFNVRIVTTDSDYYATGKAQFTVFNPQNEVYTVYGAGSVQVDTTPGRDVPIQYDFNGDGATDLVGYRFDSAEYHGNLSNNSALNFQYGVPKGSYPVSGSYGGTGTFIYGDYRPDTAVWVIALPQSGGFTTQFGVPKVDIPVPASYDGNGIDLIATFRPKVVSGGDADSFNVNSSSGYYQVSFTSPAVTKLGFKYLAGDIPAPADYDGVGKDEFAVYRPSTGQFFILKTPNVRDSSTWTMRTVSLNLPNGPNVNDVPASADYDGNGKINPTVYRTSNATFYTIHSSTGIQENIQVNNTGTRLLAAAGPLLYRLTALTGVFAVGGGGGVSASAHSRSFAAASTASTAAVPNLVALAASLPTAPASSSPASTPSTKLAVTVGASTPRTLHTTVVPSKAHATDHGHHAKTVKAAKVVKKHAAPLTVHTKTAAPAPAHHGKVAATPAKHHAAVAVALEHIVVSKKKAHHS